MVSKHVWFINSGKSNLDDLGYPHDLGNLQLNFVVYGIYGRYKPRDLKNQHTLLYHLSKNPSYLITIMECINQQNYNGRYKTNKYRKLLEAPPFFYRSTVLFGRHHGVSSDSPGFPAIHRSAFLRHQKNSAISQKQIIPPWIVILLDIVIFFVFVPGPGEDLFFGDFCRLCVL